MEIKITPRPSIDIPESLYSACAKAEDSKLDAYPGKGISGQDVVFLVSKFNHVYCLTASDGHITNLGKVTPDKPNHIDGTCGYRITGPAFKTLTIS